VFCSLRYASGLDGWKQVTANANSQLRHQIVNGVIRVGMSEQQVLDAVQAPRLVPRGPAAARHLPCFVSSDGADAPRLV